MIVYRQGDDVPGGRIREILVYEDCISQPDRTVEKPDNSDLLNANGRHSLNLISCPSHLIKTIECGFLFNREWTPMDANNCPYICLD